MMIVKGPFNFKERNKALSAVVQARVMNQLDTRQLKTFYVAFLNLEYYLTKLTAKPKSRFRNKRAKLKFAALI